MTAKAIHRFDHVKTLDLDGWGIVEGVSFRVTDDARAMVRNTAFSVCRVDSQRIAVFFVEVELTQARRAEIAAAKPDWLDVIVFAEVDPSSNPEVAVIDAQIATPEDASPTACAIAAVVVVESHGAFQFYPRSYLVRLPRIAVEISMQFDGDSASWHGEAVIPAADA